MVPGVVSATFPCTPRALRGRIREMLLWLAGSLSYFRLYSGRLRHLIRQAGRRMMAASLLALSVERITFLTTVNNESDVGCLGGIRGAKSIRDAWGPGGLGGLL